MVKAKKTKGIIVAIISVIFIIVLISIWMYLISKPTIVLSCKDKIFLGFSNSQLPMTMVPEPNACNGYIEVKDQEGNLICSNSDYSKVDQERTKVLCPELRKNKGKLLTLKFETYSDLYGNGTGETTITYEK